MPKKKSSFKFIHVADLHLGRKISVGDKSSKKENSEYFSLIDEDARKTAFEAPLTALENLVKAAIENKVDFIVIAGDVFDKHENSGPYFKYFKQKLVELSLENIRVYIAFGNHDRTGYKKGEPDLLSEYKSGDILPDTVFVFNDSDSETFLDPLCSAAIHGQSYEAQHIHESLVDDFPQRKDKALNIGVIHTNFEGTSSPDEKGYAPTSLNLVKPLKYDYWALGHIHKRYNPTEDKNNNIEYSGSPHGLDITETGKKGCYMVSVEDNKVAKKKFLPLDRARFFEIQLHIESKDTWSKFIQKVQKLCLEQKHLNPEHLCMFDLKVTGKNSEINKNLKSLIQLNDLVTYSRPGSDGSQIIRILNEVQNTKSTDDNRSLDIVEALVKEYKEFDYDELTDIVFNEAKLNLEIEIQNLTKDKNIDGINKKTFERHSPIQSLDEQLDIKEIVETAKLIAENILNGKPYGVDS